MRVAGLVPRAGGSDEENCSLTARNDPAQPGVRLHGGRGVPDDAAHADVAGRAGQPLGPRHAVVARRLRCSPHRAARLCGWACLGDRPEAAAAAVAHGAEARVSAQDQHDRHGVPRCQFCDRVCLFAADCAPPLALAAHRARAGLLRAAQRAAGGLAAARLRRHALRAAPSLHAPSPRVQVGAQAPPPQHLPGARLHRRGQRAPGGADLGADAALDRRLHRRVHHRPPRCRGRRPLWLQGTRRVLQSYG
eukprot:1137043-Prymnesium_polylepis.1